MTARAARPVPVPASTEEFMTITVIGATGKAGTLVARGLLAEGSGCGPWSANQARPAIGSTPIPARRSAPSRPGPGWRTGCIHAGKDRTPASNRRELERDLFTHPASASRKTRPAHQPSSDRSAPGGPPSEAVPDLKFDGPQHNRPGAKRAAHGLPAMSGCINGLRAARRRVTDNLRAVQAASRRQESRK